MSTANLDGADLRGVLRGGLIREDVMEKIWDISKIPLPFTDMIGSSKSTSAFHEWTTDELAAPDITNARVDGADAGANQTVTGQRVGNHHQISDKVVKVSFRADASNTIGRAKELAYQVSRRQQELRRDIEAIMLINQASVADDGNATPGRSGGLPAWIRTNFINVTPGGFNTGTGLVAARTPGVRTGLTETNLRLSVEQVYNQGGEASILMARTPIIRQISSYLFTTSARIASIFSDIENSRSKATAMGAINVFVTDFGTLSITPNRLQTTHNDSAAAVCSDVFILDPSFLAISYLQGFRTEELAKTGTANNRQMLADWTLEVGNEKAQACIYDINEATAVVT